MNITPTRLVAPRRITAAPAPTQQTVPAEPAAIPAIPAPVSVANKLMMRGECWEITFDGCTGILEDCRGLRYIALLIQSAASDRGPIHAKELVALATGQVAERIELEADDFVLDPAGRRQLMNRLEDLAGERERACAAEAFDRAAELDEEYERIAAELRGAGSRKRGKFNDAGERARKAVAKAITEAIGRVASCSALAPCAQHFSSEIRKGLWLSYNGRTAWQVEISSALPAK